MSKTFTKQEVEGHKKADSLWIIIDGDVYDVTQFQDDHPGQFASRWLVGLIFSPLFRLTSRAQMLGGKKILTRVGGKDASKQFWKYHNEGILKKYQKKLQIGSLDTKPKPAAPAPAPAPAPAAPTKKAVKAAEQAAAPAEETEALEPYGAQIPYSDPAWYQSVSHSFNSIQTCCLLTATIFLLVSLSLLQWDPCRSPCWSSWMDGEWNRAKCNWMGRKEGGPTCDLQGDGSPRLPSRSVGCSLPNSARR